MVMMFMIYTPPSIVKLKMHGFDVNEILNLKYELNCPWARGSGPRAGPIYLSSKNMLYFRKWSSLIAKCVNEVT